MKSIGEVFDTLATEGLMSPEDTNLKNEIEASSPWFIQGLLGLGGWIGAFFFFAFASSCFFITMGLSGDFEIGLAFSILGAVCLLATTAHIHSNSRENLFASQFRLVVHLVGHIALIGGVVTGLQLWRLSSFTALLGLLIVLQMATFIWLYPDGIFRFLAAIALVVGLNLIIYDFAIAGTLSILIGLLGLTLFYIFGGLMPAKQEFEHFEFLQSVPYGLAFGFFGTIVHELSYGFYSWAGSPLVLYQPYISSVLLLALLFWMLTGLLRSYEIKLLAPSALFIMGLVLLIAIPTLKTPGILAGVLLSLLAFRRKNWILLGISYAFLAAFIIYFYYSLEMSLDMKSYILMATGLALLLGRVLFQRILPNLENTEAV